MSKQDPATPEAAEAVKVIDALGGPSKVVELLGGDGVITPQAVSQWKRKGIPRGWRTFLRSKHCEAFGDVVQGCADAARVV